MAPSLPSIFRKKKGPKDIDTNDNDDHKKSWLKSLNYKLMIALLLPVFLETLDYTVVATAQSHIASVFNALPLQSYIGTSYLLSSTVFLPFFASVADIYGRHFGLQVSLLLFFVGSAIGTGAMNMGMVLGGRGIAGIGAAGLLTIVRTVMSDTSSLNANNVQQSAMFLLYAVGFAVGPLLGGVLVTANFRWVFAINLPCTVAAMLLCFILLRGTVKGAKPDEELPINHSGKKSSWLTKLILLDWIGTFLFVGGGILILLALNWGPGDMWKTARVIASLVIGAILFALCIVWEYVLEQRQLSSIPLSTIFCAQPMLPLEMFTSYDICTVQYGCFVSGVVMFVMFYFVAIFATIVTGLSPSQSGVQLLYFAPGMGIGSLISIRLINHFRQPIYPIVAGSALMTAGLGLIQMAMEKNTQYLVDVFLAVTGAGVGFTAGPLVVQGRFSKPNRVATVNALMLFFRSLGGTVGLAQCFTVMNAKVNSYTLAQIRSGTLSGETLDILTALFQSGGLTSLQTLEGFPSEVQDIVREAFRNAVRWCFISLIPWLGIATISSVFLSKITEPEKEKTGAEGQPDVPEEAAQESKS
ncbi:MFS general substrate transporter [Hygrophoropsis aurantiaca]|uniref:MFS general substrate transporter n=1 Tax=Hygrophoropsis aurantiaca TaxID=72124 RepID=A0ACB8A7F1_9AGAM|nr:MFS general substrate transporter [Hygrophoropsis aurantiaca]